MSKSLRDRLPVRPGISAEFPTRAEAEAWLAEAQDELGVPADWPHWIDVEGDGEDAVYVVTTMSSSGWEYSTPSGRICDYS